MFEKINWRLSTKKESFENVKRSTQLKMETNQVNDNRMSSQGHFKRKRFQMNKISEKKKFGILVR